MEKKTPTHIRKTVDLATGYAEVIDCLNNPKTPLSITSTYPVSLKKNWI
jgi:hypothetical protein